MQFVGQADSPQWLKDRRYNEGAGIRAGDLELHPGIAGEVGYDSNYLLRSTMQNVDNGPPRAPVISALEFRVTPSFYLSTLGPQRREGELPPAIAFRAGVNATYRELVGLSNNQAGSTANDISKQRNVSGAADARLDILPLRPWGASIFGDYSRVIQPSSYTADPNNSFNTDNAGVGAGDHRRAQPAGRWIGISVTSCTTSSSRIPSPTVTATLTQEAFHPRGRWRFRPAHGTHL